MEGQDDLEPPRESTHSESLLAGAVAFGELQSYLTSQTLQARFYQDIGVVVVRRSKRAAL